MTEVRESSLDVDIREAAPTDVAEIARLLDALGYPTAVETLAERFERFDGAGEQALLAEQPGSASALLGLMTLHATPVLHRDGPVGRITMLVVDPAARGRGIGRQLVAAAESWAAARGCVLMEVTSNRRLTDAHAFYERLGYESTSFRFGKKLA